MTKQEFKEIRQALKLRGFELAKKIGRTINETFEYESGKRRIPDDVAKYLRMINPKK